MNQPFFNLNSVSGCWTCIPADISDNNNTYKTEHQCLNHSRSLHKYFSTIPLLILIIWLSNIASATKMSVVSTICANLLRTPFYFRSLSFFRSGFPVLGKELGTRILVTCLQPVIFTPHKAGGQGCSDHNVAREVGGAEYRGLFFLKKTLIRGGTREGCRGAHPPGQSLSPYLPTQHALTDFEEWRRFCNFCYRKLIFVEGKIPENLQKNPPSTGEKYRVKEWNPLVRGKRYVTRASHDDVIGFKPLTLVIFQKE